MILNLLKAEYKKNFIELKTYYPDQIVDIIIKYFIFVAFFIGFGKDSVNINDFYIGYLYWMISSYIIAEASSTISFEKQVGTIEQIFLKPTPILLILVVRTLVMFSISLFKFAALFCIVSLTMQITFVVNLQVILIFIISVIGFIGIGIALSGVTLLFAKTASFEAVISYALLLISGTIISYSAMPAALFKVIRVIPVVMEIDVSQKILKSGVLNFTDFSLVLLSNIAMFAVGCLIFRLLLKRVKRNGIINKY